MRMLFLAFVLLVGCGSDDSGGDSDDSASATPPDAVRLNIKEIFCSKTTKCSIGVTAEYTAGFALPGTQYELAVSIAQGETPPAECGAESVIEGFGYATFDNLELGTKYSFRGCLFLGGVYSPGATGALTTSSPTD